MLFNIVLAQLLLVLVCPVKILIHAYSDWLCPVLEYSDQLALHLLKKGSLLFCDSLVIIAVACIVQAADAISAARPAARSENYENYIKRLQKLEGICSSYEGVEKCYALQAGREIRVMVVPEIINDEKMVLVARQIAKQIENEMDYPGQVKVNLIRESRVVDYAK